jgi:hypothetical protein
VGADGHPTEEKAEPVVAEQEHEHDRRPDGQSPDESGPTRQGTYAGARTRRISQVIGKP